MKRKPQFPQFIPLNCSFKSKTKRQYKKTLQLNLNAQKLKSFVHRCLPHHPFTVSFDVLAEHHHQPKKTKKKQGAQNKKAMMYDRQGINRETSLPTPFSTHILFYLRSKLMNTMSGDANLKGIFHCGSWLGPFPSSFIHNHHIYIVILLLLHPSSRLLLGLPWLSLQHHHSMSPMYALSCPGRILLNMDVIWSGRRIFWIARVFSRSSWLLYALFRGSLVRVKMQLTVRPCTHTIRIVVQIHPHTGIDRLFVAISMDRCMIWMCVLIVFAEETPCSVRQKSSPTSKHPNWGDMTEPIRGSCYVMTAGSFSGTNFLVIH